MNKLSKTAKELVSSQIGYRNNNLYNSGVINFLEIFEHELFELGNTDIIDTMKSLYPDSNETISINYKYVPQYISRKLECDIDTLKGIWITSKSGVEKYYLNDKSDIITTIDFSGITYMIVSDLDEEGILIAYKGEDLNV